MRSSIANLHNNNNVTGNLDGLGERGFINLGNVSEKNNDDFAQAQKRFKRCNLHIGWLPEKHHVCVHGKFY